MKYLWQDTRKVHLLDLNHFDNHILHHFFLFFWMLLKRQQKWEETQGNRSWFINPRWQHTETQCLRILSHPFFMFLVDDSDQKVIFDDPRRWRIFFCATSRVPYETWGPGRARNFAAVWNLKADYRALERWAGQGWEVPSENHSDRMYKNTVHHKGIHDITVYRWYQMMGRTGL